MTPEYLLECLADAKAVLTNSHFIYTSGLHGTGYVNMRAVAHNSSFLSEVGENINDLIMLYEPQIVLGPETLGRTLSVLVASAFFSPSVPGIWCDIVDEGDAKRASFNEKLDFGRLIQPGTRVAIVDDLLTTGSSVKLVADLVTSLGGEVVVAAVAVRRSPDVDAQDCGAQALEVLAEIDGFATFTEAECKLSGPCSKRVPVVLRPGHGHEWIKKPENNDYPVLE